MVLGGLLLVLVYKYLLNFEFDWVNIDVVMVDECWVDVDYEKSNEVFIKSMLL